MDYTKYLAGARILLLECGQCKPEDNIIIVTDTTTYDVGMALWEAAKDFPKKSIILMDDRTAHAEEPPDMVAAAMKAADVTFNATKYSINLTVARKEACKSGTRSVNMVDYTLAQLVDGGIFTVWDESDRKVDAIADAMEGGSIIHITTPGGTDYTTDYTGFTPVRLKGRVYKPGQFASPPDVEVALFGKPGYGDGVIVSDVSMTHPRLGLVQDDPVTLYVEKGVVTRIEGGKNAEILKDILESNPDKRVYNVGEVAVGLNDRCLPVGRMLEDEGIDKTAHIALGNNLWNDTGDVEFHLDMMQWYPTITIDGRVIMVDGNIVIDY